MTQDNDTTDDDAEAIEELAEQLTETGPARRTVVRLLEIVDKLSAEAEDLNDLYMEEKKRGDRLELRVEALSRKVDTLAEQIDGGEER